MEEQTNAQAQEESVEKWFLKYTFFKVVREWRLVPEEAKRRAANQLKDVLEAQARVLRLQLFSLVGIRGDVDFMVLADSKDLAAFQELVSGILATGVGGYLEIPYSYLAMTRRSRYLGPHKHPSQEGDRGEDEVARRSRFMFVYPFIKKRTWYSLPFPERQRIMAEHFKVGHKYPMVKINTGYSFGIDDQEFVLAFEADNPADFLALVEELRTSEASKYTELETPIFTCMRVDVSALVDLIA